MEICAADLKSVQPRAQKYGTYLTDHKVMLNLTAALINLQCIPRFNFTTLKHTVFSKCNFRNNTRACMWVSYQLCTSGHCNSPSFILHFAELLKLSWMTTPGHKCCFSVIAVYCFCQARGILLSSSGFPLGFACIVLYFFYRLPSEACQAFPQHDAATTAVHVGMVCFLSAAFGLCQICHLF